MKNVSSILLGAMIFSVAACGNNKDQSTPVTQNRLLSEGGQYQATLTPLNAHLAGDVSGTALIKIKADAFNVEVKVNGSPAQISHAQKIHVADACPTLASDTNKDGVIDAVEGLRSYGPVIIPLDNDLITQLENKILYPSADFTGNYFYKQNVSITAMMKDLSNKDNDLSDDVVKIKSGLGLAGRQVVIYGVPETADLPDSVATIKGQTKYSSLPIACGALIKIADDDEGTNTNGGKE